MLARQVPVPHLCSPLVVVVVVVFFAVAILLVLFLLVRWLVYLLLDRVILGSPG